ncbi:MAG: ABC transporter ATP-binding protein [Candidatus Omnitrophota bacterium]
MKNLFRTLLRRPICFLAYRLIGDNPSTAALLKDLCRRFKFFLALTPLFNLMAAAFEGVTLGFLLLALDVRIGDASASTSQDAGRLGKLLLGWKEWLGVDYLFFLLLFLAVFSQILKSGMIFFAKSATANLQAGVNGELRARVFRQFMRLSYCELRDFKAGDMANYAFQADMFVPFLGGVNLLVSDFTIILCYVSVLLWISWPMTLLAAATLIFLSFLLNRIIRYIRAAARELVKATIALNIQLLEYYQGIRLIRSFAKEEFAIERNRQSTASFIAETRKGLTWEATIIPLVESLTVICLALLILICSVFLDISNKNLYPQIAVYIFVMYRLMPRAGSINNSLAQIAKALPYLNRVADFLREDDKKYIPEGGMPVSTLQNAVEFDAVSFIYEGKTEPALKNLSFAIPKGGMTAIVGTSGAGKTTVLNLLLRFYDPTQGRILVDGVDLRELDRKTWLGCIGLVDQGLFIFNTTIRENIAFGKQDASQEEIEKAARLAHAHDFIMQFPCGYDTLVGERGQSISGGQRQRLAIARALVRQSPLIVFDEATSELDSDSENQIRQAMESIRKERTIVIIAHRLSTISSADRILVLENGQLEEHGTHQELLAKDGRYAALWKLQSHG